MSNPDKRPDLSDAFDAPYIHKLPDGSSVRFARFDLDELAELGATIKADRVAASRELAAELSPIEQYRAQQEAAWAHVLDGDIYAYVQTPKGTMQVLHKSLQMGGRAASTEADEPAAKAARDAVLRRINPYTKTHIAMVVTGIAKPVAVRTELRADDGSEPGFGNADEVEVQPKEASPLPGGGPTSPST